MQNHRLFPDRLRALHARTRIAFSKIYHNDTIFENPDRAPDYLLKDGLAGYTAYAATQMTNNR